MSEYQYYEFKAVDRPLTKREMGELRALSTRASITSTRFMNTYEWGDFKGNPDVLINRYFDAFVYLANWGTRRLSLRFPQNVVDAKKLSVYCQGESARIRKTSEHIVLDIWQEDVIAELEDEDDETIMASLIPLREEVLNGDLRCLYLGWLLGVQNGEFNDDDVGPVIPRGLAKLSSSLESFVDFLRIDRDLIAVASQQSLPLKARPTRIGLSAWIEQLPEKEKNTLLLEAASANHPHFRTSLLKRFERDQQSYKYESQQPRPFQ